MSGNKAPLKFRVETPSDMSIEPEQTYSFDHLQQQHNDDSYQYEEQKVSYLIDPTLDAYSPDKSPIKKEERLNETSGTEMEILKETEQK